MNRTPLFAALATLAALAGCGDRPETVSEQPAAAAAPAAAPVVVYSSRAEQLIKPVFDAFTADTGIEVQYITDSEQPLIQRLKAEGETTPASVLLTVDAGNLWYAAQEGVLAPTDSERLESVIPPYLRDRDNRWFGLSLRARTILYDTRVVDPAALTNYAGLADPQWRGRLCLRTSKKVYNQSLVAMMIAELGEERAEEIVSGWVQNLATDVFANDTQLIEALLAGQCEVGIVNTYYFGRMQRDSDAPLPLKLYFPSAEYGGVHVNVSGAGITRHAPDPEAALALLEWLAGEEGQTMFARSNLEFPVAEGIELDPIVAAWGDYTASQRPLSEAGEYQAAAVRLMDRAGYR